ncbi:hypothetical protein BC834DRAFT_805634, partial [Gloeopeniophorella convolvens]
LSILESTISHFAPASAIWFFDTQRGLDELDESMLMDALASTLSAYPHFAGQLFLTPYPKSDTQVPHTKRFRRVSINYGSTSDPGILLVTATASVKLSDVVPEAALRHSASKLWDITDVPVQQLFPTPGVPLRDLSNKADSPGVQVQITTFADHGIAIAIRAAHPLADAQTLASFAENWGAKFRGLSNNHPPLSTPVFNPALFDAAAAGDIDASAPDSALVERSRALPFHRYDYWTHTPGNPPFMDRDPQVIIPQEVPADIVAGREEGVALPWHEWDVSAPVRHYIVHFTSAEVDAAYALSARTFQGSDIPISRHDAFLAFIWHLIARARPLESTTDDTISLNVTLGLRTRLGLPASYVGSPTLLTSLVAPHTFVAASPPATLIRKHIQAFTPEAIGAWLHAQAFEIAPQRFWSGFLGRRHVLATSWVRVGLWDVDFGDVLGGLRWASSVMPSLDGMVTTVEAQKVQGKEWWRGGIDVNISLEEQAMKRFM